MGRGVASFRSLSCIVTTAAPLKAPKPELVIARCPGVDEHKLFVGLGGDLGVGKLNRGFAGGLLAIADTVIASHFGRRSKK